MNLQEQYEAETGNEAMDRMTQGGYVVMDFYTGDYTEWLENKIGQLEPLVSKGAVQPVQNADIGKQEELVNLLYEFNEQEAMNLADAEPYYDFDGRMKGLIWRKGVGITLNKIMNLFGYKVAPIE